jgi:hypothetical protein
MRLSAKGYAYTLEVMIAISMVIVFTVLIFTTVQTPVSANTALVRRQGYEALEFLEQTNELRPLVFANDETSIKNRLRDLLPPAIALEADVCVKVCEGNLPQGKTIVSVEYYVSGYNEIFFTKKVKLWMWGSF